MSGDEAELRAAWRGAFGAEVVANGWCESVLARHREPHRRYHTLRHVRWVVRHVGELAAAHQPRDRGAVIAAAFFHDAVYEPGCVDNETASANLAAGACVEIGWALERAERVAALVLATADHSSEPGDLDTAILIAADLAVLAAEPGSYGDYVRGVRAEYAALDDEQWRTGRVDWLRGMLARPAVFPPSLDLKTWETHARANLTAELAALA